MWGKFLRNGHKVLVVCALLVTLEENLYCSFAMGEKDSDEGDHDRKFDTAKGEPKNIRHVPCGFAAAVNRGWAT